MTDMLHLFQLFLPPSNTVPEFPHVKHKSLRMCQPPGAICLWCCVILLCSLRFFFRFGLALTAGVVVNIDVCANECVMFYGPFAALTACPKCGTDRLQNGKPAKRLTMLPLLHQLARLFEHKGTARAMRWAAEHKQADPNVITDVTESPSFIARFVDSGYLAEPRNAVVSGSFDSMCPFGSGTKTMMPLTFCIDNLPPEKRIRSEYMLLAGIIRGSAIRNVNSQLEALVDEFVIAESSPMTVYDADRDEHFQLHIRLNRLSLDYPGSSKVTLQKTGGLSACHDCTIQGVSASPGSSTKVFPGSRRALPMDHWMRTDPAFGAPELRSMPPTRTHEETHHMALVMQSSREEFGVQLQSVADASAELGVLGESQLFRVPGFNIIDDIGPEMMHATVRSGCICFFFAAYCYGFDLQNCRPSSANVSSTISKVSVTEQRRARTDPRMCSLMRSNNTLSTVWLNSWCHSALDASATRCSRRPVCSRSWFLRITMVDCQVS